MRAKHRIFAHLSNSHYFRAARLDIPVVKLMMVTDEIGIRMAAMTGDRFPWTANHKPTAL